MRTLKSKILAAALALTATPLLAAPQGTPAGQGTQPNPPASSQEQAQGQRDDLRWRHRRHHWRRHRRHHQRWHRFAHISMMLRNPAFRERLGITPEQAARIEVQQSAFMKTMIRSRADVQVKRLELGELLAADKPDPALIDKKLSQLNEVQFAARKAAIENHLAMREMFTPEQRQKMRELFWEMRRGSERSGPPWAQDQPGA